MGEEDIYRSSIAGMQADLPTARGVSLCLHKLAEEAADLGLVSTEIAIRQAIDACRNEVLRGRGATLLPN
jgi:hypothetical protein